MTREIILSKVKINYIQVSKHDDGYECSVNYTVQNDDGSESFEMRSIKYTSESEDIKKLSVGSDALVVNFVNAITILMADREDL